MYRKNRPIIERVEIIPRSWGSEYIVTAKRSNGWRKLEVHGTRPGVDCPNVDEVVGLTLPEAHELLYHYDRVNKALAFFEREVSNIKLAQERLERMQESLKARIQKAATYDEAHRLKTAELLAFRDKCLKAKTAETNSNPG